MREVRLSVKIVRERVGMERVVSNSRAEAIPQSSTRRMVLVSPWPAGFGFNVVGFVVSGWVLVGRVE